MPCAVFWVVSHWLCSRRSHIQQSPHETLNGITTRSPMSRCRIELPVASTVPIGSWPTMSPGSMKGESTS